MKKECLQKVYVGIKLILIIISYVGTIVHVRIFSVLSC